MTPVQDSATAGAERFIAGFIQAWREHDSDLIASLFTPDGRLYYSPLEPPVVGHDAIREFWAQGTAGQSNLDVTFGPPAMAGGRAVAEWWATVHNDGQPTTEPGCALITLDQAGRCTELREYSSLRRRHIDPPANWLAVGP
ncbi:MAG: hypothetical protein QOH75_1471 [Actinomycetota bacterium]|nr:hypothetical protein [Actinomycetota bacterium]